MKKLLAVCLAAALACSLTGGALAATTPAVAPEPRASAPVATPYAEDAGGETSDARLAAVTLKVKNILDLDTEEYEEFSGNLNENGLVPVWNLYWSGQAGGLNISSTEDGEILSLNRYEYDYYRDPYSSVFGPRYPADHSAAARAAAEDFLANLLGPAESVQLEQNRYQTYLRPVVYSGGEGDTSFASTIYLNGLPSPLSLSISVREDGTVVSYYRDVAATKHVGALPSAAVSATEDEARAALRATLEMKLEYVLADDGETAILRYLPVSGDQYYVNSDGELVNLSELMRNVTDIYSNYRKPSAVPQASAGIAMDADAESGKQLSDTELKGVEKLEGVLSREALADALIAAYPALGLEGFTLSGATYSVAHGKEETDVNATLSFSRSMHGGIQRRTVTVDAKTAALSSVYTSYPWQSEPIAPVVDFAAAETAAAAFLTTYFPTELAGSEETSTGDAAAYAYGLTSHSFDYTRKVNGYFYRGNNLSIGIDPTDGTVASFYRNWSDDLTFASPEGIVSEEAAIDAYLNAYLCDLQYLSVPFAIDGSTPQYKALMEMGYGYFYHMVAGYQLGIEQDAWFVGVDAADGVAVVNRYDYKVEPLTYDDLDGSWAKGAIERLAAVQVGFAGGKFEPAKPLTQLDLVALLISTNYGVYDLSDENAAQSIYNSAYNMGLLRKSERDDDKVLTRMETARLILDASGYGRVAQLPGIYRVYGTDAADIVGGLGYAAIAQALGILRGNSDGQIMPNANATRAEAAAMLDQFMSRSV